MPGTRLRVMTFNIHGGRPPSGSVDLSEVAKVIREANPDLVGLQEVHRFLPPPCVFQDQPGRLRAELGLEVCFRRSFGLGPVGYGNAILSRRPLDECRCQRLPASGSWSAPEPRRMLDARFTIDGAALRFVNTHLGLREDHRKLQVARLAEQLRRHDGPLIVVGDFNTLPESLELRPLLEAGLTDCAAAGVLTFPCHQPTCRIDHIFVSRHFEVKRCFAVDTRASDHLPLVADLVLRG
jgi:endonuclease/exonuclease/phosphatase family metal-dependent hydrolase